MRPAEMFAARSCRDKESASPSPSRSLLQGRTLREWRDDDKPTSVRCAIRRPRAGCRWASADPQPIACSAVGPLVPATARPRRAMRIQRGQSTGARNRAPRRRYATSALRLQRNAYLVQSALADAQPKAQLPRPAAANDTRLSVSECPSVPPPPAKWHQQQQRQHTHTRARAHTPARHAPS